MKFEVSEHTYRRGFADASVIYEVMSSMLFKRGSLCFGSLSVRADCTEKNGRGLQTKALPHRCL